ncbi:Gfo/Idh/MocA family oxidoreductase [Phenylobacterium sp.]|uniref:Gfo/Idh/MocA family protein n=1 Tax=Phenylobacterium sp. TaxID=1871053 RepID=UPI00286E85FB|nr:Gfo/Idh/MocA family oxidoreductase [Phenylobacterium sp.]
MTGSLRGGVIGAGVFGGYHARQYAEARGVTLAGVFDTHPDRAAQVAMPLGGRAFNDIESFLDAVDVVTIASPASYHADQALAAIAAGKHVYVEKPIAVSVAEAERMRTAAATRGVVLACGHQERVVFQAMGLLDAPERPLLLEALRHGPPSPRSQDVSAVLDLMIHDIDLVLAISRADPVTAEGEGALGPNGVWDQARAEVTFESGLTAILDVSRLAPARRRTMRIVYPSGEVEVDFIARTFRNTTAFALNADFADTPAGRDPLGASVRGFLAAVRGETARPVVTADEAIAALDLALAVEQALENAA